MFAGDYSDPRVVLDYLCGLKPQGSKLGIDRMRLLSAALGTPAANLPVIHLAGTNGKGSVAAMIESILRAAGWRVGLYTSPHLIQPGERIQINRTPLSEREVAEFVRELDPVSHRIALEAGEADRPSFFELMTAMAFLAFQRSGCDIAVVETGLGGEFDATNVVSDPLVTAITSIGLDHAEYLGETIPKIARAKAGIVKRGRPVVLGRMPPEAMTEIVRRAATLAAPIVSVAERFGDDIAGYPSTSLAGDYQRWNAATATLAVRQLPASWRVTEQAITDGLREVRWPGRWDRREIDGRTLVLDASHNPEGAAVLDENLRRLRNESGQKPALVVGVLGVSRARSLLEVIARHAREIHLVVPAEPRACSHDELAGCVPRDFSGPVVRTTVAEIFPAADTVRIGRPGDVVVVTGSIYLMGEVFARLKLNP